MTTDRPPAPQPAASPDIGGASPGVRTQESGTTLGLREGSGPRLASGSTTGHVRRFLAVVALVAILESGLIMGLNVAADPRNDFHTGLYAPLVPDYPAEKLAFYNALEVPPKTLLFGSSKAQSVDPDDLEELGFGPSFNFAIPRSSSRDHLLLYRYLVETDQRPETLILGLDGNMFWNAFVSELAASRVSQEFGLPGLPIQQRAWRLLESLSPFYVWDSIQVLEYTYISGYPDRAQRMEADGQIVSPRDEAAIAAGTFDREAAIDDYITRRILPPIGVETGLAPIKQGAFRNLVSEATAAGTQVIVYLTTNHPTVLERLADHEEFQYQLEETRRIALEMCSTGIALFDFLSIDGYGGDPDGFYDGWHINPDNARREMATIAGQPERNLCLAQG